MFTKAIPSGSARKIGFRFLTYWGAVTTAPPHTLNIFLINEAPGPVVDYFDRFHDRMFRCVEMSGSVFVVGSVAAPDVPACQT